MAALLWSMVDEAPSLELLAPTAEIRRVPKGTRAQRSSVAGGAGLRALRCVHQAQRKTHLSKGVQVVYCLVDSR